jgi:hypothetical protein
MSTLADVFVPVEAHYRTQVLKATWGHLAPRKNKTYRGSVVFALGCFDNGHLNPTPLTCEFEGLDDSPWFYEALIEFLQTLGGDEGGVYRWDGTFLNYEFRGAVERCALSRPKRVDVD